MTRNIPNNNFPLRKNLKIMLIWNVVENTKSRRSSLKLDFARKPTKESDLFFGRAFFVFYRSDFTIP